MLRHVYAGVEQAYYGLLELARPSSYVPESARLIAYKVMPNGELIPSTRAEVKLNPSKRDTDTVVSPRTDPPTSKRAKINYKTIELSNTDFDRKNVTGPVKICKLEHHSYPHVKISEDGTMITRTKGYRTVKATHGFFDGTWYYEIRVPETGAGHVR